MTIQKSSITIQTVQEMENIANDRANEGRTYAVSKAVFDHYFVKLVFLPHPPGETERINKLLGTTLSASDSGGMTRSCKCGACDHDFTFADHIESSIRMGVHSAVELKEILDGDAYYLTVDTERTREIMCVKCGMKSVVPHCCYAASSYAYAKVI